MVPLPLLFAKSKTAAPHKTPAAVVLSGVVSFGTHYRAMQTRFLRNRIFFAVCVFFVIAPVMTLALVLGSGGDLARPSVLGLPTWVGLMLGPTFGFGFLPLCLLLSVWQTRRKNVAAVGLITFAISGDGLESRGDSFEVKLRWSGIHQVVETKNFFRFYIASSMAQFIPKSFVQSPEQLQKMRELIQNGLGSNARLQSA